MANAQISQNSQPSEPSWAPKAYLDGSMPTGRGRGHTSSPRSRPGPTRGGRGRGFINAASQPQSSTAGTSSSLRGNPTSTATGVNRSSRGNMMNQARGGFVSQAVHQGPPITTPAGKVEPSRGDGQQRSTAPKVQHSNMIRTGGTSARPMGRSDARSRASYSQQTRSAPAKTRATDGPPSHSNTNTTAPRSQPAGFAPRGKSSTNRGNNRTSSQTARPDRPSVEKPSTASESLARKRFPRILPTNQNDARRKEDRVVTNVELDSGLPELRKVPPESLQKAVVCVSGKELRV